MQPVQAIPTPVEAAPEGGVQQLDMTPPKAEPSEGRKAAVRAWLARIQRAEKKWAPDFKRMRSCMEFAAGVQREGQPTIDSEDYIANVTNRSVAQKVSALYARDPKVRAVLRDRLDYSLWDGKIESVALAFQKVAAGFPDPNALALINDYSNGNQMKEDREKVGKTLECVYQWQVDQQEPEFKKQAKQLVRRVVICGVGYVRQRIELPGDTAMSGDGLESNPETRMKRAHDLLREMLEDGATEDDARVEQVQALLMGQSAGVDSAATGISRLLFEFPMSTAIVPDPKCRQLKDFVGADWVAERFVRPRSEVEAFFEVELDGTASGAEDPDAEAISRPSTQPVRTAETDDEADDMVLLYEVHDKRSKSRFIVCRGHDDYVLAPEPVLPPTKRFWPWFALTFNDVEIEPGCDEKVKASIFPPSDVHLLKPMQKEWNRARQALREHRTGSVPFYVATVPLNDQAKEFLKNVTPNDVLELPGLPPGTDPSKVLAAFQPATLNPLVYQTVEVQQDILMTVGTQEANLGPTSGATATESTIAEQSRVSNLASNTDDLDDLLTDLARAGGELLMRTMSEAEVKAVAGAGALWPPADQVDQYAQEVVLTIEASSSGRPNKALDVSNFERIAPWLLQAGANPKFLVEEGLKRLDERIPVGDAFPLVPPVAATPLAPEPRGKQTTQQMMPPQGGQQPV